MKVQLDSDYPCQFHHDRDAHFKCELCPNLICSKCIMKNWRVEEKNQRDEHGHRSGTIKVFVPYLVCPVCYHKHMINRSFSEELKAILLPMIIPESWNIYYI